MWDRLCWCFGCFGLVSVVGGLYLLCWGLSVWTFLGVLSMSVFCGVVKMLICFDAFWLGLPMEFQVCRYFVIGFVLDLLDWLLGLCACLFCLLEYLFRKFVGLAAVGLGFSDEMGIRIIWV